jgi:hypothetical protein
MATRARSENPTGALDEFEDSPQVPAVVNGEEIAEDNMIARIRSVIAHSPGDRVKVMLYRFTATGQRSFCCNYTPEQFEQGDFELIRDEWGAGRFEVRMVGKAGLMDRPREIEIAEGKPRAPVAVQQNSELAQIMRTMAEGQSAILAALSQRPDPAAQMQQTIALMAGMRDAMGLNAAPAVPTAPAQSPSAMLKEMAETMSLLKDIAAKEAPPSDDPMAMLPQILGIVQGAMSQRGAPVPSGAVPMIAAPASLQTNPATLGATAPAEPQGDDVNPLQTLMIRGFVQKLVSMAAKGESPEAGGTFVYEKLPDEALALLDMPNWFEILAQFEPSAKVHQAWFEAAHACAMRELANDAREDAEGVVNK